MARIFIVTLLLSIVAVTAADKAPQDKTCMALALSGGGAKGSYEAGALWGLVMNSDNKTKFAYDVVTGVSAGAINTGAISLFTPGDEENLVHFLSDTWAGINDANVYKQWSPFGILTGLFSKSGVFDDAPLMAFLASVFQQFSYHIQRKIVVSCVDVVSGAYITFNESTSDPVKAITSSASIPFVFPHQTWNQDLVCMDGGTVWNTNLVSAIQRCHEIVDDDSQITMDIIICGDYQFGTWSDQNNAYNDFLRYKELKDAYQDMGDVYEIMQAYPDVNYRYYIQPSEPLPGGLALLRFDNTTSTWPMQMLGRLDGENAVKDGEGWMFSKFDDWRNSKELQEQFPRVNDYVTYHIKAQAEKHKQERRQKQPWNATIESTEEVPGAFLEEEFLQQ